MGEAIATRLNDAGYELRIWNRSPGKGDALKGRGATEASSADDAVEGVDVVITSLANDEAVRQVALSDSGLASCLGPRPYIDASTISPSLSAELGQTFERFVAMPVLGAPHAVQAGEALYLAGGSPAAVDAIEPILEALGGRAKRYDRPEVASAAKLTINILLLSGVATLAEALAVGRAGGVSDAELADLLADSPMVAPGLKNRVESVFAGHGTGWWTTALGAKDAGLAVALAAAGGHDAPISSLLSDLYRTVADSGYDQDDIVSVARLYR
jgi:3-hydroxyisobutyrate dehydrogenase